MIHVLHSDSCYSKRSNRCIQRHKALYPGLQITCTWLNTKAHLAKHVSWSIPQIVVYTWVAFKKLKYTSCPNVHDTLRSVLSGICSSGLWCGSITWQVLCLSLESYCTPHPLQVCHPPWSRQFRITDGTHPQYGIFTRPWIEGSHLKMTSLLSSVANYNVIDFINKNWDSVSKSKIQGSTDKQTKYLISFSAISLGNN